MNDYESAAKAIIANFPSIQKSPDFGPAITTCLSKMLAKHFPAPQLPAEPEKPVAVNCAPKNGTPAEVAELIAACLQLCDEPRREIEHDWPYYRNALRAKAEAVQRAIEQNGKLGV